MGNAAPDHPVPPLWTTKFVTRLHRYRSLLLQRWWILLLTVCIGLFVQAWLVYQRAPLFLSQSKTIVAGKLNVTQNAVYSEETSNFYGTQIQLMQSEEVKRSAEALVRSTHPEMEAAPVEINVAQKSHTSIFELEAIGANPEYTQAYLNALMQKYLDFKKGMREGQGHNVTTAITEQLIQVEKDLRTAEDELLEFQKQNNIGFIQEEGNSAAAYLVKLNQNFAALKTEYDLLSMLDLDQNLDRKQAKPDTAGSASNQSSDDSAGMAFTDNGPEGDYLKARQALQVLRAERDTLSKDLRPKHPKILKLDDEIAKQENLIKLFREDSVEKLDTRRKSIGIQMENLQRNIAEWEKKALDLSQRLAQFNRIKGKADRLKTLYDRLTKLRSWKMRRRLFPSAPDYSRVCSSVSPVVRSPASASWFCSTGLMTAWLPSVNFNISSRKMSLARSRKRKPRALSRSCSKTTRGTSYPNHFAMFVPLFSSCRMKARGRKVF